MQLTDQPEPGVWAPISIHAPIKDATKGETASYTQVYISIHAPIKDATVPNFLNDLKTE